MTEQRNAPLNLDRLAASLAQQIVKKSKAISKADTLTGLATKALGVLQEQGVYACMLFLYSRSSDEEEVASGVREVLVKGLAEVLPPQKGEDLDSGEMNKVLEHYAERVVNNLDSLFLLRDLYERTLIYTRYLAKAASK